MKNTRESSWRETARILGLKPDPDNPGKLLVVERQNGKPSTVINLWAAAKSRRSPSGTLSPCLIPFATAPR